MVPNSSGGIFDTVPTELPFSEQESDSIPSQSLIEQSVQKRTQLNLTALDLHLGDADPFDRDVTTFARKTFYSGVGEFADLVLLRCLGCRKWALHSMRLVYPAGSSLGRPSTLRANVQGKLAGRVSLFQPARLHSGATFRRPRLWELAPASTARVSRQCESRCRKTRLVHLSS